MNAVNKSASCFQPYYVRAERYTRAHPYNETPQTRSFWDLDDNLRMNVLSVSNMHVDASSVAYVYLRVAITVGRYVLDVRESSRVPALNPRWVASNVGGGTRSRGTSALATSLTLHR